LSATPPVNGRIEAGGTKVGSFGAVDLRTGPPTYGHITATSKPGWARTDVVSPLRGALGVPVGLDTDVNAAALGSWRRGAGRGLETVACMTVLTGIGVGAVVNGRRMHGLLHPESGRARLRRGDAPAVGTACRGP
jgi:fructokinase